MKNDSLYEFVHVSLAYSEDEANITDTQLFYTLEDALEYIQDDELVEITPQSVRIRKADLVKLR